MWWGYFVVYLCICVYLLIMKYTDYYNYLTEAFGDDQKKKWLANNPTLTSGQVDTYIKWFDELRKSKPAAAKTLNIDDIPVGEDRFDISKYKDWHSFELFVDAVRGQTQLKGEKLSDNLEVIDAKPLFEKNGLEVYYADTPRACIKYKGNVPYSWCVARPDSSNMFYSYRLRGYNPAFYFVKDVDATKKELSSNEKFNGTFKNKWHFFVIQVLKTANINNPTEKSYVVTSANNDGDVDMSWNDIVKIEPKLKGLQSEFLPKPLSPEELNVISKYRNGITTQEFVKLPYNEKERFLDVYPAINRPISDEIFKLLPVDLKNKYIGMNIGLSGNQYEGIQYDKNLLKRYAQMTEKKFQEWLKDSSRFNLVDSEIDVLSQYNILDKYVDKLTGANMSDLLVHSPDKQKTIDVLLSKNVPLTDSNVYYLLIDSPDPQKTIDVLLSKGLSIDKILTDANVYRLLDTSPDPQQTIDVLLSKNIPLTDTNVYRLLDTSPDPQQTIDMLLSKGLSIDKILPYRNVYSVLRNSPDKQTMVDYLLSKNVPLTDTNVGSLLINSSDPQQTIDVLLSKNVPLTDTNVGSLLRYSPDKQKIIDVLLSKGLSIDKILTNDNVGSLLRYSPDKQKIIDVLLSKNVPLTDDNVGSLLRYSPDKQKIIDVLLSKNVPLTDDNVGSLLYYSSDPQQTIDMLLSKNVPLTDTNVSNLLYYSPNERDTQQKIDMLKAKQQLSESKIKYKDYYNIK